MEASINEKELSISEYRVKNAPETIYYIPEFITPSVEKHLINQIYRTSKIKWTQLLNRRLQNWGGVPQQNGMIPEEMPEWLSGVVSRVNQIPHVFDSTKQANHVLLNEYLPGVGIMPHLDGDLYYPTITTVSLGSSTLLDYYAPIEGDGETDLNKRRLCSVLLEPRSLLIVKDDMYHKYLHGIDDRAEDVITEKVINVSNDRHNQIIPRETRISLTIRHVPKTMKHSIFKFKK